MRPPIAVASGHIAYGTAAIVLVEVVPYIVNHLGVELKPQFCSPDNVGHIRADDLLWLVFPPLDDGLDGLALEGIELSVT